MNAHTHTLVALVVRGKPLGRDEQLPMFVFRQRILRFLSALRLDDNADPASYRVNAGTVFFVGYDDHYRQGNQIDERLFPTSAMLRTNRAVFTKLQYLFRY